MTGVGYKKKKWHKNLKRHVLFMSNMVEEEKELIQHQLKELQQEYKRCRVVVCNPVVHRKLSEH